MHLLEVLETGERLEFPAKVSELSGPQYEEFCRLFLMHQREELTLDEFLVALVYVVLEVKQHKNRKLTTDELATLLVNVQSLSETLLSFWKVEEIKGEEVLLIDWYHEDQKIKTIEFKGKRYHGPKALAEDLKYGEYVTAHQAYRLFVREQDPLYLDQLCAALYRPEVYSQWFGRLKGTRVAPGDINPEKHLEIVKAWPYHIKYGVFVWWSSLEEFIPMAELPTDAGTVRMEKLFKKVEDTGEQGSATGVRAVLYELAESNVFGNVNQVEEQYFWNVMLRLYQLQEKAEKQREELDKLKDKNGSV
jgi:hypothetical protein